MSLDSCNDMIEIIEINRQIAEGMTKPYICKADNGKTYVVKGKSATGEGRAAEWIIGSLGKSFGLPIPDFEIANISPELIEFDVEYQNNIGSGPVFASEYVEHLQTINYSDLKAHKGETLLKLFVFDYWVRNDDRTLTEKGGNPNL